MANDTTHQTEEPNRLKDAQDDIRTAYFDNDCGLFVLSCVAGAGKSTADLRIGAEDLLRKYVAGDMTPEQHIAVVSFGSDEANEIVPELRDELWRIVEHNLCPVAEDVSAQEVEYLIQRLQQAPFIGTIDSVLRGVLKQFAEDIGFDEVPAVGNEAVLARVHADCYEALNTDSKHGGELDALKAAYPADEYDDSPAEMLQNALTYCRDRQLSTAAFREELEQTQAAVYEEQPGEFDALVTAVERVVGNDSLGRTVRDEIADDDRERLVTADKTLYDKWSARIDEFCNVLATYRQEYQEQTREYGAISHTDVAFLVASYLDGSLTEFLDIDVTDTRRQRILQRYHGRLQSLIIDEAQDVSEIQHTALAELVTSDMRVLVAGDVLQSIYTWRHADPTLFESAAVDGEYLGIDWTQYVTETATTTYRCVPDVAEAINEITEPMFTDETRGNLGAVDTQTVYERLDPARDSHDDTAVHIAAFDPGVSPGSAQWAHPENGTGEADKLAQFVSAGLEDGTLTGADGAPLDIVVLFRRGTRMSDYKEAFEDHDDELRVRTVGANLFNAPEVEVVCDVCDWLVAPESSARTKQLFVESHLGLSSLVEEDNEDGETSDGVDEDGEYGGGTDNADVEVTIDTALKCETLSEDAKGILTGLQQLRDRRDVCGMRPASVYLEDIIEQLGLRADAYNLFSDNDSQQRVANLDALIDAVSQWETDDQYSPQELTELLSPFRDTPRRGPAQPSVATSTCDVEFRNVHPAKGDEYDAVVIADPGFDSTNLGVHNTRLVTQGPVAGLAPPTNVNIPTGIEIPGFANGLYNPDGNSGRDIGLRWATVRWADSVTDGVPNDEFIGPDRLQQVVHDERAELWRLLYVALTRARDQLVVPLPKQLYHDQYRDRWIETLKQGLDFGGDSDSYKLSTPRSDIDIGVNDADPFAESTSTLRQNSTADPAVAVTPPDRAVLDRWMPRVAHPSTMYPLTENPAEHAVSHLLGESIHTESNDVSADLDLPFAAMGPDEIGSAIHDMLTQLVDKGVSEAELQSRGDRVTNVFDEIINNTTSDIAPDDRDRLWDFFSGILDDFLESELWGHIQEADAVSVEKPIDGLIKTSDIEVEIHGQVDFVVDLPSGKRVVTDVKIALAEPTQETQRRYDLQVSSYSYLFGRQDGSVQSVRPTIETFGVTRDTVTASWRPEIIEYRIRQLSG